ncbi:MAG: hypothetical protein LRZ88_10765 [Candidatus Cloacimonetes bacterium]|nr:hypothetical protein [Candidatus Cloacimonadota bacterium]
MIRYPKNPVITRRDLMSQDPALIDVSSIFNPGGVMHESKFLLLLRVQNRARETFFVKALSSDGLTFELDDHHVPITNYPAVPTGFTTSMTRGSPDIPEMILMT